MFPAAVSLTVWFLARGTDVRKLEVMSALATPRPGSMIAAERREAHHESDRAGGLWLAERAEAARSRDAGLRRRRRAGGGARGVGERARLAPGAGRAVLHSDPRGHRRTEAPRPRRRSGRPRDGGRKERHAVQAG